MVPLHRLAPAWVSSSAHLYLPFARHTTPANWQPLRVSLRKELWWILTPEVLWRSPEDLRGEDPPQLLSQRHPQGLPVRRSGVSGEWQVEVGTTRDPRRSQAMERDHNCKS